jgi:hypothetical protein
MRVRSVVCFGSFPYGRLRQRLTLSYLVGRLGSGRAAARPHGDCAIDRDLDLDPDRRGILRLDARSAETLCMTDQW